MAFGLLGVGILISLRKPPEDDPDSRNEAAGPLDGGTAVAGPAMQSGA